MITWITTIGWSPFAVINPVWAYCKEYDDCPSKFILIHTGYEKIKKNLEIVKSYLKEIARGYSKKRIQDVSTIIYPLYSEDIQNYATNLKRIIIEEVKNNPKKIVLDMTPGRKYMSAINIYYGLQSFDTPIQVFYLHLEESRYQNIPYPLTPIIKNELIDVIDSTEIFTKNIQELKDRNVSNNYEQVVKIIKKIENDQDRKERLILLAVSIGLSSKNKIKRFLYENDTSIQSFELRKVLKKLEGRSLIKTIKIKNRATEYIGYEMCERGLEILRKIQEEEKNE